MKLRQQAKAIGIAAGFVAIAFAGMSLNSTRARADSDNGNSDESKVKTGFEIAPVMLNLKGKNRDLVGLGSYIVNAQGDCNGCHSKGPQFEFSAGGNPYFGEHPTVVNPDDYLGGGRDFGAFPDPMGPFPHIVSRNLTPDHTGRPLGGAEFSEFLTIIRTGKDFDYPVHPTCTGAPNGHCIPAPFNGMLLQIMPWPIYAKMTDRDIRAIYEYLSAIPCVAGPGHVC